MKIFKQRFFTVSNYYLACIWHERKYWYYIWKISSTNNVINEINKIILLPFLLRSVVLLCWLPSVLVLELVGRTILWPLPLMPLPPPMPAAATTGGWVAEGEEVEGESRRWAGLMAVTVLEVVVVGLFSLSLNVSSSLSPSKASGTGERLSSSLLLGGYTCMWGVGEREKETIYGRKHMVYIHVSLIDSRSAPKLVLTFQKIPIH